MKEISPSHSVQIDETIDPGRLDKTLSAILRTRHGLEVSTRRVRGLCDDGKVRLNGRSARSGDRVSSGDLIEIFDEIEPVVLRPDLVTTGAVTVQYEDSDLIVVVKPRAIHGVRLRADDPATLADMIASICPEAASASLDLREGGAVQRLDYFTSGLVVAAKRREVWDRMHQMLMGGEVNKRYRAVVEGRIDRARVLDMRMTQSSDGTTTVPAEDESGEVGSTAVRPGGAPKSAGGRYSVAIAESAQTRRHQVRFHLAEIGHPLVGDKQYGARLSLADIPQAASIAVDGGFLLHAESLEFLHPATGRKMKIEAPSELIASIEADGR